jgi:hypothetical protein
MVAKPEGLAQLVFLDQLIDEVNRPYAFHGLMPLGIARRLPYRHAGTQAAAFTNKRAATLKRVMALALLN